MNAANVNVVLKPINPDEPDHYPTPLFVFLARYFQRLGHPDPTMRAKAAPLGFIGSDPGIWVIQPLAVTREIIK